MLKRKLLALSLLISASFLFGGCLIAKPADITSESPNVTLTGTIVQAGTKYSLSAAGRAPIELDSRQVDLATYSGKTITVTGQYSGTTLFVSKIE